MPLFQRATMAALFASRASLQDMACFFYIVDGQMETVEGHGVHQVGESEALLKSCGNFIQRFRNPNGEACQAVAIYLYPDVLHEVYKNKIPSFLESSEKTTSPKKMVANELIEKYINNLFIYFDNPDLIDEDLALLKLKELVLILLKSNQFESISSFLQEIFNPNRVRFSAMIENHLFSNITLEELAYVTGRSLSTFKRDFKKYYQESPARYIKKRRLEQAEKLLRSTSNSISEIAYNSGFQDVTTFSSSFKTHFNGTPSEYRLN